jgi:hypothetical protein
MGTTYSPSATIVHIGRARGQLPGIGLLALAVRDPAPSTRVKWLGISAYCWLVMRLGVDTVKPDKFDRKRATRRTPNDDRRYLLAGMLCCGIQWPPLRSGSPRSNKSEKGAQVQLGRVVRPAASSRSPRREHWSSPCATSSASSPRLIRRTRPTYAELGVSLTYDTDGRVAIEALPREVQVRVGGGTRTLTPRAAADGEFLIAA